MTDLKLSELTDATTPLDGTEAFEILQSSANRKLLLSYLLGLAETAATEAAEAAVTAALESLTELGPLGIGDVDGGNYTEFEADGTIILHGDARTYDDIQVSITLGKVPAANAPTWTTWDFGLGGPAFAVLGFGVGDYLDFYIQTSHRMELSSILDNHIHWTIPSDAAGDRFKFALAVIGAAINADFAAVAGSPFTHEITLAGDESGKHKYFDLADIPAINTTVSTIYVCRLQRSAASVDEYAGQVYVIFNDSHFLIDSLGSREEMSK